MAGVGGAAVGAARGRGLQGGGEALLAGATSRAARGCAGPAGDGRDVGEVARAERLQTSRAAIRGGQSFGIVLFSYLLPVSPRLVSTSKS